MPVIRRQFNLSDGQWPGPNDEGYVEFTPWDNLPRNTRIRLHRIGWFANAPGGGGDVAAAGSIVTFAFVDRTDPFLSTRIILLDAEADDAVTTPARTDGSASVDLCPTIVPRLVSTLTHFRLEVTSTGLNAGAGSRTTLCVDWDLEPFPDSSGRDGLAP